MSKTENILVIKLSALGDFIQALGPMAAIRNHHPDANITLLTTPPYQTFAKECGYFDSVIIDTKPRWFQIPAWLGLKNLLNKKNFTRIYDLQNNDRTNWYFKFFKNPKPEWVGTAKGASHRNISPERTAGHAFDGHVQTLELAGLKNITPDPLKWMNDDISTFEIKKPYILLIPGCAPQHSYKRWPAENYGELAIELGEQGFTPVIIGSDYERLIADVITIACPKAVNLIGKTNLKHIAELARNAKAAIGNDTGPIHIIAPTGCPTLILFSKHSNPMRHAPKIDTVTVLQKDNLKDLPLTDILEALKVL